MCGSLAGCDRPQNLLSPEWINSGGSSDKNGQLPGAILSFQFPQMLRSVIYGLSNFLIVVEHEDALPDIYGLCDLAFSIQFNTFLFNTFAAFCNRLTEGL